MMIGCIEIAAELMKVPAALNIRTASTQNLQNFAARNCHQT